MYRQIRVLLTVETFMFHKTSDRCIDRNECCCQWRHLCLTKRAIDTSVVAGGDIYVSQNKRQMYRQKLVLLPVEIFMFHKTSDRFIDRNECCCRWRHFCLTKRVIDVSIQVLVLVQPVLFRKTSNRWIHRYQFTRLCRHFC